MKEFIQELNFIIIYSMRFQDNGVKYQIHILNRQEMSEIILNTLFEHLSFFSIFCSFYNQNLGHSLLIELVEFCDGYGVGTM